jgi:DNA polymerase sigma
METTEITNYVTGTLLLFGVFLLVILYLATQNKLPSWPQIKKWGRKSRPYKWFHQ